MGAVRGLRATVILELHARASCSDVKESCESQCIMLLSEGERSQGNYVFSFPFSLVFKVLSVIYLLNEFHDLSGLKNLLKSPLYNFKYANVSKGI